MFRLSKSDDDCLGNDRQERLYIFVPEAFDGPVSLSAQGEASHGSGR